ncbi:MAG: UDP-2,4-diacetamido-2,4,6-trideoxy-beta-L-altropyranose hydrolase [Tabrizicola sp.]|nr:UDP-2,4-diacetamido-2,4,6-trideoxy-beta-L-altropyranose hydrolase [Tabrizicola sp.]
MKFAFRTDAATSIGSGHVMRCLTLARVLAEKSHDCRFVCRDLPGNLNDKIAIEFPVVILPRGDGVEVDWQADALKTAASVGEVDWLLVDHYELDARWEKAVRPCAKRLIVLDDLADRPHACNLLLDQSLGRRPDDYSAFVTHDTQLLLGPEYALLRPEFSAQRSQSLVGRNRRSIRNLLVVMGGFDADNTIGAILQAIANLQDAKLYEVSVAISSRATHLESLRSETARMPCKTSLRVDETDMAGLMKWADVAISASGLTAYELACMGVPMILLPVSAIQLRVANELSQIAEAVALVGWQEDPANRIGIALADILTRLSTLAPESRRVATAFDGLGAIRVAEKMCEEHNV